MESYINPSEVISPKAHWHLFDVVLDHGEGGCAYALGTWDGARRVGFRWNGSADAGRLGNPQSRGLPTWTILDPSLYAAVVALLPPEKHALAKRFLGLRAPAEWQALLSEVHTLHRDRVARIAAAAMPVATLGGAHLVMHVVPLSAVGTTPPRTSDEIFRRPEKFPPMGSTSPRDSMIDHEGLLTGSLEGGLREPQRAYTHVSRTGIVEAVASSLTAGQSACIDLSRATNFVVKYAQFYGGSLNSVGIAPPFAIAVSFAGVKGMRLVQDLVPNALEEDLPFGALRENIIHFGETILETVPSDYRDCAKALRPLLSHLANAAGLTSSPFFDAEGNYTLQRRDGL